LAKPRTEAEFGEQVLAFLRARGWHCYSEIELVGGSTTDIVAIRNNRVRIIELKLTCNADLLMQLARKYNSLSQLKGVRICGMAPLRHTGSFLENVWHHHLYAYDGATCWRLIAERINEWPWSKPAWAETTDLSRPPRTKPTEDNRWEPGDPADPRFLAFFKGIAETNGAGTPTGSKTISQLELVINWAEQYPEKVSMLMADEAVALAEMWLPRVPNCYGGWMVSKARQELYARKERTGQGSNLRPTG
jgi:hypothetical protein